jgi:hypothetical protein
MKIQLDPLPDEVGSGLGVQVQYESLFSSREFASLIRLREHEKIIGVELRPGYAQVWLTNAEAPTP